MAAQGPSEEPAFTAHLKAHFKLDPETLAVVSEEFPQHEHPNVQVALDDYLAQKQRSSQLLGIVSDHKYMGVSLSHLIGSTGGGLMGRAGARPGPVEYVNIPVDGDRVLTCVQCGLCLIRDEEQPLAVLLRGSTGMPHAQHVTVEVMAPERAAAEAFLAYLRTAIRRRSVYRGHVLSLSQEQMMGSLKVEFHHLPKIDRQDIILAEGLLERIERQTIRFAEHSEKLLAAGRHLKRGLLLHGPPGTGKTLSVMYLARAIQNRTVLLLTGRGLSLIEQSCALARALQPSIVVLEDVDLVAEERTRRTSGCASPLLFELLNQMDGLADDADVLFLLTTNRPDLLEPALAARPGRIDQAIELGLPDEAGRRRLIELYGRGLTLEIADLAAIIKRTEGASPAFIRELLRKAALFAADDDGEMVVTDHHLEEALRELLIDGGDLTKSLLGFRSAPADEN